MFLRTFLDEKFLYNIEEEWEERREEWKEFQEALLDSCAWFFEGLNDS
jgi:hypothetical protein